MPGGLDRVAARKRRGLDCNFADRPGLPLASAPPPHGCQPVVDCELLGRAPRKRRTDAITVTRQGAVRPMVSAMANGGIAIADSDTGLGLRENESER